MRRIKAFFVCPGLGHIARGYETFTRECFDALASDDLLDLYLYKGEGPTADREQAVWCLRRSRVATQILGTMIRRDAYYVEQSTFAFALLPKLVQLRPDVVYFSDGVVGNLLWRWRRLSHARFKLLLSNGGPLGPPAFPRFDHVHQVSVVYHEESLRAGRPAETQTLIPYGFRIKPHFHPLSSDERSALRCKLGLPTHRPVVLSVGAINSTHKRMDYVIREVDNLPAPRPFLLMLGQLDRESPLVMEIAAQLLGPDGFSCRTVPPTAIFEYFNACDTFVLGSLSEGFSRAMGEAFAHGLPCLVADRGHARFVLGEYGHYEDFDRPGRLTRLLTMVLAEGNASDRAALRHAVAYDRYSWDRLRPQYVDMIERCARGTIGSRK